MCVCLNSELYRHGNLCLPYFIHETTHAALRDKGSRLMPIKGLPSQTDLITHPPSTHIPTPSCNLESPHCFSGVPEHHCKLHTNHSLQWFYENICRLVLYCILWYCIVLYCIVSYCIVSYCTVLHCIVLCRIAFYRIV